MSESAAPLGSSRCTSGAYLRSYTARRIEQQKIVENEDTEFRLLKRIASEESDAHAPVQPDQPSIDEIRARRLKLHRAAIKGDWAVAKGIYDEHKDEIGVTITSRGDTALHIAAVANHIDFVKELVKIMRAEHLAQKNKAGCTALSYAAAAGMVELAREMMKDNKNIAMVSDRTGMLPIVRAAAFGHRKMVVYLYEQSKDLLTDDDCVELLVKLIEADLYAVALQLLRDRPQLATKRARNEETALHVLARKHLPSSNENRRGTFQKYFDLVSGSKAVENMRALELAKFLWERFLSLSGRDISKLTAEPRPLIFDAAKHGNAHFLSILIREYPDLIWKVDEDGHTIFHIAVSNRMEKIFKFIFEISSIAHLLLDSTDKNGNNILHLAGQLPPVNRLNVVSVAALQLQRELLWFQAVKKVVPQKFAEAKNNDGLTPEELFIKEHKELKKEGETWVEHNASSCMIVATLIATVVFASAITVPGGNKEDIGLPFFRHKTSFKVFAVSNVISLVFSTVSMVNFLSILAPRYAEEDFLNLLSRKLLFGLATLFISIAAMMVVFSATSFIVLGEGSIWIANLAIVVSSMPVILFIKQHFRLFDDILRSNNDLMKKGKTRLFYKEEEKTRLQKTKLFNRNLTIPCTSCSTEV